MALKFGRAYKLEVQAIDGTTITLALPFTIQFDIVRNTLTSANTATIRIYNLSVNNRALLRKDAWATNDFRAITLYAGYGSNLPKVFDGNIMQAWSVREGVNFITQIECFDGGFAFVNGLTNLNFPAGTPQRDVITTVMATGLPNVTVGSVGAYPGALSRGNSYAGNTVDILKDLTGGGFFVDNGKANALGDTECLAGQTLIIDSADGLLGTPVREQFTLYFDMLFEPSLVAGQKVTLDSITAANFNGDYKVVSTKHRGMISDAVCGEAITSVGLFAPPGVSGLSVVGL